jgi:hypothetical protein
MLKYNQIKFIPMRKLALVLSVFAGIWTSCQKADNDSKGTTKVDVRMTDAAGPYDSVVIDVQSVQIIYDGGSAANLNTNAGVYDLLDFTNGKDTLIASATVPSTTVAQVRLILGSNNYVVVGGIRYPLKTPSAQESGLKLDVHAALIPGTTYVLKLDFDAARSIVLTGNGMYILKPVIRIVTTPLTITTGSISGATLPDTAWPVTVTAINTPDTFSSVTDTAGAFIISNIPAATYTLILTPKAPYINDTIRGIVVTAGNTTLVGTVRF